MTTWIPDKMAANQTRTAWLPDVNNEDRLSENTKGNYLLIIIMYTKFIKLETTQNTTTADIYIAS